MGQPEGTVAPARLQVGFGLGEEVAAEGRAALTDRRWGRRKEAFRSNSWKPSAPASACICTSGSAG